MEAITRNSLNEILQEELANPVPLSDDILVENGFRCYYPAPDFIIWANEFDITFTQEGDYPPIAPYMFRFNDSDVTEKIETKYEQQLKKLIDDYDLRLTKEMSQLKLF